MATTAQEKELMNKLYKDYGLTSEHVFSHKHFKIITRAGIDIIISKSGHAPQMEVVGHLQDGTVIIKAWDDTITTFASAGPATATSGYYAEIAEKRVNSRFILKRLGLYSEGVMGEDEADDFKKSVSNQRAEAAASRSVPGARTVSID
jgi:hypothetical protein